MAKARRNQANPEGQTKAERKKAARASGLTKAERKKARAGQRGGTAGVGVSQPPGEDAPLDERIEWRLARIEEAVATQSARSEELLARIDEVLGQAPPPATQAKADSEPDDEGA